MSRKNVLRSRLAHDLAVALYNTRTWGLSNGLGPLTVDEIFSLADAAIKAMKEVETKP